MNQVAADPSAAVKHIQQGELLNGSERRISLNVFNKCSEECSCISLKGIKKLTSEFIDCLQGMKVNERKWQSYNSRMKINNEQKCVWEVQSFCGMCNSTESNRRLSEAKPLNVPLNSDLEFAEC